MFPDGAFDTVFELESICHARKVRQVLSEVFRVLKKEGDLLFTMDSGKAVSTVCRIV